MQVYPTKFPTIVGVIAARAENAPQETSFAELNPGRLMERRAACPSGLGIDLPSEPSRPGAVALEWLSRY